MYNKSEIFKAAWVATKSSNGRYTFATMLKASWDNAKRRVQWEATEAAIAAQRAELEAAEAARFEAIRIEREAQEASLTSADRAEIAEIEDRLFYINMADRWSNEDRALVTELNARIEAIKTKKAAKVA